MHNAQNIQAQNTTLTKVINNNSVTIEMFSICVWRTTGSEHCCSRRCVAYWSALFDVGPASVYGLGLQSAWAARTTPSWTLYPLTPAVAIWVQL